MTTVQQIDPQDLSPLLREANRNLMVGFINANLIVRYGLDVNASIVFYSADKEFLYATGELPDAETLRTLAARTGVRFWSRGC